MSPTVAATRTARSASDAVLSMLRTAHHQVLGEFDEFEQLDAEGATQACQRVVQRTFAELKVIAQVEKQVLYPALSEALSGTDLIEQSEIEHARIGRLIDSLEVMTPGRNEYRKGFMTLGEHVKHHIEDEEVELFALLPRVALDWDSLYEAMRSRRAELAEELGIANIQAPGAAGQTTQRRASDDRPDAYAESLAEV